MTEEHSKNAQRHSQCFLASAPEFVQRVLTRTEKNAVQGVSVQEFFDACTAIVADLIESQKLEAPALEKLMEILDALALASAEIAMHNKKALAPIKGDWSPFGSQDQPERHEQIKKQIKLVLFREYGFNPSNSREDLVMVAFMLTCFSASAARNGSARETKNSDISGCTVLSIRGQLGARDV